EAQVNVAIDVAEQILMALQGRPARSAVNVPAVSPEAFARIEPFLRLARQLGKLHAQLADGTVRSVSVAYSGELLNLNLQRVTRAVLIGLLQPMLEQPVNEVNAPVIAESRGIRVTESKTAGDGELANLIRVTVEDDTRTRCTAGTALNRRDLRIREIDRFAIDLSPEGHMIFAMHRDRPGVIGTVGTILGAHQINIA